VNRIEVYWCEVRLSAAEWYGVDLQPVIPERVPSQH
jgi:hypothetical protein